MLDFLMVATRIDKKNEQVFVYPKFLINKSRDLMIRGGDFYAIWIQERGLWSTEEQDALNAIDRELDIYVEEHKDELERRGTIIKWYMWDAESGMIDKWHKYCQKQMRDSFHVLDENLIFSNMKTKKTDYASKKLSYPLEPCDISAYDRLMSTLYSEEERQKIEWAIGSIVTGDSKVIQKFMVLYGSAGTGKSTVLNIIQDLFDGYYSVFNAKALGSSNDTFALEAFKSNPLVAIQHDGDLSKIEDNTRLNSLVSHELMTVNEKFKSTYSSRFRCFLFMGTNKPVKITDAKSGLIRRLIDVTPTGNKLKPNEYKQIVKQIKFELGGIACHCRDVYLENPGRYDDYIPVNMMEASNDFYNFILDSYLTFKNEEGVTLKSAWSLYKTYCEDAKVAYAYSQRVFKEELKNYFRDYKERYTLSNGTRVRNYYISFITDKFEKVDQDEEEKSDRPNLIKFDFTKSIFDKVCEDCPAQYTSKEGTPMNKWEKVKTKLSNLDTSKLHYVKVPENHIVIDFDIPDENGNKCFEKNLEAASKWPVTYAELSKSGAGIHLHYIYTGGDPSRLSRIYDENIEVKVFTGNSSLRRMLTKCNNLPIATISSGLPLKGDTKMINFNSVQSEKSLRILIKRNLNKEIHPATKPSIDFIYKILEDAYNSDLKYDVSDMRNAVLAFAANSTHQADYCIKLVAKMKFKSEEPSETTESKEALIAFYDVEVFPNLFLVNWKLAGKDNPVIRMINPSPGEVEELMNYRLIGFNCRRYDNHILYARMMGYNNEQLFDLSQRIIDGHSKDSFFGEAFNISYTDVYDFCSKKQSLKKWEIELGIHHQELGLPWDKPVPEDMWVKVAEYCDNDVLATEAVFENRKADFIAREVLAEIAGMSVNDTTNSLTTRIIFGKNKKPQSQFNYRNMGDIPKDLTNWYTFTEPGIHEMPVDPTKTFIVFDPDGKPYFPGYVYSYGKSTYRDEEVGEGGYVYSEPGMYGNVALLDVASMHPSSIEDEVLFGPEYTKRFSEIKQARVYIKHGEFDKCKDILDGVLVKYLTSEDLIETLSYALKIAINSVYGLTSASFPNAFRDPRNKDNIVAKRGALFMINLKHAVQERGFTVAHIKTDSIKIPDATPEIINFVMEFGREYGYTFEHEATYDRMCLVNDAVYIAKYADPNKCNEIYSYIPKDNAKHGNEWTATGAQFQIPYIFKTLFSKEPITFEDMCETKAVSKGNIYIDMNEGLPDTTPEEVALDARYAKDPSSLTKVERNILSKYSNLSDDELRAEIAKGHNYIFVGRVSNFTPIRSGRGGGILYREVDGKYYAVAGTKGYRWLESEIVKELHKEDDIDRSYYDNLVTEAVRDISAYGDFEWFVSDDPYVAQVDIFNKKVQTF